MPPSVPPGSFHLSPPVLDRISLYRPVHRGPAHTSPRRINPQELVGGDGGAAAPPDAKGPAALPPLPLPATSPTSPRSPAQAAPAAPLRHRIYYWLNGKEYEVQVVSGGDAHLWVRVRVRVTELVEPVLVL